jgi:hypothetical protein
MKKLFENVEGNRFRLISESITEDEPKCSLIRKGLKKVFSEGEQEYSYKKLECVGLGYIRNVSEAKKCALKEARELALEFGYEDNKEEQKFVKEGGPNEEKREVQIGKEIIARTKKLHSGEDKDLMAIEELAKELVEMHSPNGPVVKPGTGPKALYKRGSIY